LARKDRKSRVRKIVIYMLIKLPFMAKDKEAAPESREAMGWAARDSFNINNY